MDVNFEKNVFEPHELCRAMITLDNSKCNLEMTGVRLAIEQEITIRSHRETHHHRYTLAEQQETGLMARNPDPITKEIKLPLDTIKYKIPSEAKQDGGMKMHTQDEIYFMG